MIRLLVDEHVPLRAVRRLREVGFEIRRVPTAVREGADDEREVLVYANDHDCLVLTNDADFLDLDPDDSPGVLYYPNQHLPPKVLAMICSRIEATIAGVEELRGRETYLTRDWLDRDY